MNLLVCLTLLCLISRISAFKLSLIGEIKNKNFSFTLNAWTAKNICNKTFSPVDFSIGKANKEDIRYWLYKHTSPNESTYLDEYNVNEVQIDRSLPMKIIVHGWISTIYTSDWIGLLKDAYFRKGPHNVIYVDWNAFGKDFYDISAANIEPVGKIIAHFLIKTKIPPSNIHLIGYSLGAHVCSHIGKNYNKESSTKLGRITGLDPAGPKFEHKRMSPKLRLSPEVAGFVDIIHTDIGCSGYASPCGHVDFYPNFGHNQPGCDTIENCSHDRSTKFFIASVNANKIKAVEAKTVGKLRRTRIELVEGGKETIFGENVPLTTRGIFYVKSNSRPPYF